MSGLADEAERGLHLRAHAARGKRVDQPVVAAGDELLDRLLLVGAEVRVNRGHLREDDEPLRAEFDRQERGSVVLVDHGVDAIVAPVSGDDGNSSAADGDDHRAALEESPDRPELEDLERSWGGNNAPPAAVGILANRPAALLLQCMRALGVIEGADRLRRLGEGGVVLGDDDAGQDDDHAPARDGLELGGDERPDLRLRLGDGDVQWERRRLRARELLAQQLVPHLRPVSMRDHDGPVREDRGGRGKCRREVRPLLGRRAALPGTEQRVAPERDDGQHVATPSR